MIFDLYSHTTYNLNQQLQRIYNNDEHIAMDKLAHWHRNVEESGVILHPIPYKRTALRT